MMKLEVLIHERDRQTNTARRHKPRLQKIALHVL